MNMVVSFLKSRWRGMHKRCTSKRPEIAERYAERGIGVCDEWATFEPFRAYVEATIGVPDLSAGTRWTIDRIDNDQGYRPGNIRWATYRENIRNRRSTVFVTFLGERVLLAELSERSGVPYALLSERIKRSGWSAERAVSEPVVEQYRRVNATPSTEMAIAHDGRSQTLTQWAAELGFDLPKVRRRLRAGWAFGRAISAPSDRTNAAETRRLKGPSARPSSRC